MLSLKSLETRTGVFVIFLSIIFVNLFVCQKVHKKEKAADRMGTSHQVCNSCFGHGHFEWIIIVGFPLSLNAGVASFQTLKTSDLCSQEFDNYHTCSALLSLCER